MCEKYDRWNILTIITSMDSSVWYSRDRKDGWFVSRGVLSVGHFQTTYRVYLFIIYLLTKSDPMVHLFFPLSNTKRDIDP